MPFCIMSQAAVVKNGDQLGCSTVGVSHFALLLTDFTHIIQDIYGHWDISPMPVKEPWKCVSNEDVVV